MGKLSIAMVVASPFPGRHGTPVCIKDMAESLAARGHTIHLVTYHNGDPSISVHGVQIHRIPDVFAYSKVTPGPSAQKPILDFWLLLELFKVVRREKIDIIHAHNYEAPIAAYICRAFTGVPVVYHAHNTMSSELHTYSDYALYQRFARFLAPILDNNVPRRADLVISLEQEILDFLYTRGVARSQAVVVPLGVRAESFANLPKGMIARRYGLSGHPLVAYTGTFDRFQELDNLMDAFALLSQETDAVLVLAGMGDSEEYRRFCVQHGLSDRVLFVHNPTFEQVREILGDASVAVVPRTCCPGIPVKLLNYMAAGLPIVSFIGAAKGLQHMRTGIVVPNGDIRGFAEAIKCLLIDSELAGYLGSNARRTAAEQYGYDAIAADIEGAYELLLRRRANAPDPAQLMQRHA